MDNEALKETFEEQADWRSEKAEQHPDDARNIDAITHLRMLAASCSNVDLALLKSAEELSQDAPDTEAWHEMLRTVGFSYFPLSASVFLEDYIRGRTCE